MSYYRNYSVTLERHINISQSQPGVSCKNIACGVILLKNSIISGTLAFMAPEVLQRTYEKMMESQLRRSDTRSFGE